MRVLPQLLALSSLASISAGASPQEFIGRVDPDRSGLFGVGIGVAGETLVISHRDWDTDDSGELSAEEFSRENHEAARKTLRQNKMFARMDADGNGGLSPDEFPNHARRLASLDTNEDGEITRDEARDGRRAMRDGSD